MNIYEALNKVHAELGEVVKKRVDAGRGGSYQAFSVDDIYHAVRTLFATHGVVVIPQGTEVTHVEHDRVDSKTGNVYGVSVDARVMGRWKLASKHDGSFDVLEFPAESRDTGDKATVQAMQLAFKYAIVQMFQIGAGDGNKEEQPPEPARRRHTAKEYENSAKQHVFEATGSDADEAAKAWPLVLEAAHVEKVSTKKEYEAVVRAANDMYGGGTE